jgi:hypothetical protein
MTMTKSKYDENGTGEGTGSQETLGTKYNEAKV